MLELRASVESSSETIQRIEESLSERLAVLEISFRHHGDNANAGKKIIIFYQTSFFKNFKLIFL
jgi:hypothetical protein